MYLDAADRNRIRHHKLVALKPRAGNNRRVRKLCKRPAQDVALLYAPTDDGAGARFVRAHEGELQTGEVRPLAEGRSLCGQELVRMRPRAELPMLFDVEVIHPAERTGRDTVGPAQVASEQYRRNWEDTFAPHKASGQFAN
jgi:hypothetical protein